MMIKKIIKGIAHGISLWFSTMDKHHTWPAFTLSLTNVYLIFWVIISVLFLPLMEGNIAGNIVVLILGVPWLMTFVDGVRCLRRGDIHASSFYIISMSCVFISMYNADDIVLLIVNVALLISICFLKVSQQCKRFFISSNAIIQFTALILYVHQFGNPTLLWLCIAVSILGLIGIIIDLIIHFKNDKIMLYTALVYIVLLLFFSISSCQSRIFDGDTRSYDSAVEDPFPIYCTTVDDSWSFDSVPELKGMSMKGLDRIILQYLNASIDKSAYGKHFKKPAQSRLKNFERVEHMRLNPLDTIKVFICRESNSTEYPYVFWNRNDTIVEESTSIYTLGDTSHPTISIVESYPFKLMNAGKFSIENLPDGYTPSPIVHDICYAFYLYVNNGVIEKAFSYYCIDVMVDPDLKCQYFYR